MNNLCSITDTQIPEIYDSSSINSNVTTGKPVQLKCYVHGMPPPTVTWFKVSNVYLVNYLKIILLFSTPGWPTIEIA